MRIRTLTVLLAIASTSCGLTACSDDARPSADSGSRLSVAVAFYPIEEITRQVGGDTVDVIDLTPPGGEPHDLDLSPRTAERLEKADVVIYLGRGFQPAVESVVGSLPSSVVKVDLLDHVDLLPVTPQLEGTDGEVDGESLEGDIDPHVWVDPVNMETLTRVIESTLVTADPSDATTFHTGADRYVSELDSLATRFSNELNRCETRTIITGHRAFEYLAHRYDLVQIPIAGISPDDEPDARTLESVARAAEQNHVTVIFFEEQLPRELSQTVADEVGATTAELDPVETISADGLTAGQTYLTIQEENLATLVAALRCT